MNNPEVEADELMRRFRSVLKFVKMNDFDHFAMKYKLSFQSLPEDTKNRIRNSWDELKMSSKQVIENLPILNDNIPIYAAIMRSAVNSAETLKFFDFRSGDFDDEIQNSSENSGWSLGEVSIEFVTLKQVISDLSSDIRYLSTKLPRMKEFVGIDGAYNVLDDDFIQYLKVGKTAKKHRNYKKTNIYKLEQLLKNRASYFKKSIESTPDCNDLNLDTAFIALVAPSLTGKTQSAFIIDELRCLYFPLDFSDKKQKIYLNFENLSKELQSAAENDFKTLKVKFPKNPDNSVQNIPTNLDEKIANENDLILSNISAFSLIYNYSNFKFFSLGFLVKLIEDSEADADGLLRNGMPWMQFHAERKDFYYTSKSISEVLANHELLDKMRSKYYLFLDEFVGHHWAVLVRNIVRCLWMSTVVANTNSDIANLIGKVHASGSRSREWDIWSFVVISLDKTDWEILFESFHHASALDIALKDKINSIIEKSPNIIRVANIEEVFRKANKDALIDPENAKFARFFHDFIKKMIPKLRPGISDYYASAIMNYDLTSRYDLSSFIDYLVNRVKKIILYRKSNIQGEPQGMMGTLALYLSNAYDRNAVKPGVDHRKSYLNHHLFHLVNPVDREFVFLTYRMPGAKKLRIYREGAVPESSLKDIWSSELTYFDSEEIFTILACLFIKSPHSIAYELGQGADESRAQDWNTGTTANPLALKLDGNAFEVLAAVSIIDSSHRRHGSKEATLAGQDGVNFIKNLVGNLINDNSYVKTESSINLNYPSISSGFDVEKFLENCRIPFLYPANLEVPEFLENLTREGTINVGNCERTKDSTKIDFKFAIEYDDNSKCPSKILKTSESKRKQKEYFVIGECKNWTLSLKPSDLIKILEKSYKKSFLSLLFCNSIEESPSSKLKEFCAEKDINVYRFRRTSLLSGENSFDIEMICKGKNVQSPEMVCFIFEMTVMNTKVFIEIEDSEM